MNMDDRIVVHPPKKGEKGLYYVTVSYYYTGERKQKRKSGFKRSKDAKQAGEEIKDKLIKEMPVIKVTGTDSPTLKDFAEEYMKIKSNTWAPNTMKNRKLSLKHCDFAHKKLNVITKMDLAVNVKRLEDAYKHNTISSILSGWSAFLNAAVEYDYIRTAPTYSLKKKKGISAVQVENVLSMEDAMKALKKIEDQEMKLYVLIGATCGVRSGEALDLNVNDIDFSTGLWKVHHQFQYLGKGKGYGTTPVLKTENSYRSVPIPPSVIKSINDYPFRTIDGFIFRKAAYHLSVRTNKEFKKIDVPITYHGLRHTYITNLIRSKKFDLQSIAKLAGDSIDTITETYVHYLKEMQDENIEKIKELFG
jgi:integrase